MKTFSKTFAALISAFVILTCALPAVNAAQKPPCPQIEVIRSSMNRGDPQWLIDKICADHGICLDDTLKYVNCSCPGGTACVIKPDPSDKTVTEAVTEPLETPSTPIETPSEKPTAPAVTPVTATEKPTEPTVDQTHANSQFNSAYEAEVFRLVNIERLRYGLSPLSLDDGAVNVAHIRAEEIVHNFSHTRPDGSSCFTAAQEAGVSYRYAGENIAYGYPTPAQVVDGWMNSEGHRKNILSASFNRIGVGCYESRGVLYWTQFFIG